ncbi:sugar phosphate isomerase/epimerase family protein [Halocatena marina]|uniref:Sugar phosphate isomerase/epimerase family protein n=1 Tax=Halocatena marina TaxID=2934937 RepID=A0ABD5YV78_9EURY|nr:sugar phosphate isomerase/epimerase family protein [Halocatena marina]
MDIGLCTITNKDWPVETVLELAAKTGYDGVEIWGRKHVGVDSSGDDPDLDTCRNIASRASDLGLEIPVYGSYLRPGTTGFRDKLAAELEVAVVLNADLIRVWPGDQEYGDHTSTHWDNIVNDLSLAGQQAADRKLGVTVEKHEGTVTNRGEGARRLLETVDSPAVGLNWQPLFHLDGEDLLAEAELLAPMCNNIHLQATREQGGQRRCLLSDAYFDLPALLSVFDRSGFDGYLEVEFVDPTTDYETSVRAEHEYLAGIVP